MTGMTSAVDSTANARTVETFLYAMQDEDFDTVEAAMADNIAWQNVGFPTIRGRDRIMKLFRRGEGRFGFEVKIHRIAAEGNTVLTERTDALVIGPLRLQFWVCGVFEVHAGPRHAMARLFRHARLHQGDGTGHRRDGVSVAAAEAVVRRRNPLRHEFTGAVTHTGHVEYTARCRHHPFGDVGILDGGHQR